MQESSKSSKQKYLSDLLKNFEYMRHASVYSMIVDANYQIIACTEANAKDSGFASSKDVIGLSYKNHSNHKLLKRVYGDSFTEETKDSLSALTEKIFNIQKYVFESKKIVSYINLLPYDNQLQSSLITYTPIFYKDLEVVALQSFCVITRFFVFSEYVTKPDSFNASKKYTSDIPLTERETEIMFLLANNITQEEIAQLLNISRNTVNSIIRNQLCLKFGVPGSNTKLLKKLSIEKGLYQSMPLSLWRPAIIVLEENLASIISQES